MPGFVQAGGAFSYVTNDGTVVPVEAVAGLRAMLQGGRAIYVATASNRYGLAVGAYAGEFKPNVVMEQAEGSSAQTGGAVLVGPVVNRLIADRLAAVKNPADRWVIALPVDVRGEPLTSTVDVSFDDLGLHGWLDVPRVVVAFAGELPVVNAIPANGGVHVLVEQQGVTAWQCIDPTRLSLPPDRIDTTHPMNELLVYGTGQVGLRRDLHVDRRVALGYRSVTATGEVSVSLVVGTATYDVTPAQILTIADVPVFVAGA